MLECRKSNAYFNKLSLVYNKYHYDEHYSKQSEVSTRTHTEKVWLHPYSSHSYKISFLLVTSNCFPSPTLRLPNMDFYLQENIERLQVSRFAGFYLSCSNVCVGFKSLPIFLIASCCFFVLLIHVKYGFLFSENLIPPCNALPVLANCTPSMALMCDPQKMVTCC